MLAITPPSMSRSVPVMNLACSPIRISVLFVDTDNRVFAASKTDFLSVFDGVDAVFLVDSIHEGLRVIAVAVRVIED